MTRRHDVTTAMAAQDQADLRRRFPDGTRTKRAKRATQARQMARKFAGRGVIPPAQAEEVE